MKLPAEWEAIVVLNSEGYGDDVIDLVRDTVERCYTLATKPPKELTDEEIGDIYKMKTGGVSGVISRQFARAIEAAVWAKQIEPERVKFRAARCKRNHREIQIIPADSELNDHDWEWLEPEQSFEVVLP